MLVANHRASAGDAPLPAVVTQNAMTAIERSANPTQYSNTSG